MPTQLEYTLTKARQRGLYTRFELLNYNFQIVGNLEGVIINDQQFNNSATSSIRRTCSISLFPDDSSFDISSGNKIWLYKYIRVYIGIKDIHTELVEPTEEELRVAKINEQLSILYSQLSEIESEFSKLDYVGIKIATGRATIEEYAKEIELMNELALQKDTLNEQIEVLKGELL